MGFIDIRIGHNKNTYYGGNIGYTIYEPFRGHHYAAKACNIIKQIAIYHNMTKLYITCNPDNIPSRKTCEKLGLEFKGIIDLPEDNEMYLEGEKQKCLFEWKL
ncbi:MAG TPA: GNAT family N-acetyltransferase [Haloplasmataceae bacterium]